VRGREWGKWVRAKDAKDAKVRKAITELFIDDTGWRGFPGSVSPATTEVTRRVSAHWKTTSRPAGKAERGRC
jgi:hypothetical protein